MMTNKKKRNSTKLELKESINFRISCLQTLIMRMRKIQREVTSKTRVKNPRKAQKMSWQIFNFL